MKKFMKILQGVLFLVLIMTAVVNVQASGKTKEVVLHDNNGRVLQISKAADGKFTLSSVENPEGYTFLGWCDVSGQHTSPKYLAGETIRVTGRKHLYAVMFQRKKEKNIPASELPILNTKKYSEVIFVGDSRTVGMQKTLQEQCGRKQLNNVSFVCKSGQGLKWFRSEGIQQLNKIIEREKKSSGKNKKIAVVFNLGINDIRHRNNMDPDSCQVIYNYLTYMNKLSSKLEKQGCILFYMSVNPINASMSKTKELRREWELLIFNKSLKEGLNSTWNYIDVFERLINKGYSSVRESSERDDGIHYSAQTYKRIYKYCIEKINRS